MPILCGRSLSLWWYLYQEKNHVSLPSLSHFKIWSLLNLVRIYFKNTTINFVFSFSKVWLLILIAMIVVVVLLSLFSGVYLKYFTKSDDRPSADGMTMLGRVSSYSIYVVNILTNQGKVSTTLCFSLRLYDNIYLKEI